MVPRHSLTDRSAARTGRGAAASRPSGDERRAVTERVDCVVVGGGPAGLSAATQVARLARSCVLVDDDRGRSLWSQTTRNYLGFPDGIKAADLRLLGQRQALRFGAILRAGRVSGLRRARHGPGFDVLVEPPDDVADEALAQPGLEANRARERVVGRRAGERPTRKPAVVRARAVLLATGVADHFPQFDGRDACVGISLFWCIVCDGWEARGQRVVIVGDDADALSAAFFLARLTDRATLVTNRLRSRLPAERQSALEARGVRVARDVVATYVQADGQIEAIELAASGERIPVDRVFASTPRLPRTALARRLGARHDRAGYLEVDDGMRTTIGGLYAAGDIVVGLPHQVGEAAATGAIAATAMNFDLTDPPDR